MLLVITMAYKAVTTLRLKQFRGSELLVDRVCRICKRKEDGMNEGSVLDI